jgi:hypothetical protein
MAHFDWYQATVDAPPRVLAEALMELPGAVEMVAGRGRQNYHHSMAITSVDGDTLATVLHGGLNGAPNAYGSGEQAEAFAAIIRQHWPEAHRVTRVDSAEDVRTDFRPMHAACRAIAAAQGVKGESIVPDDLGDGSTYYMGARSSATRLRCYEKGKQLAPLAVDAATCPIDWVRLEVQWKPVRDARLTAASLSPGEVWGVSAWTRAVASQLLATNPDRVVVRPRLRTTYEARLAACMTQYGALFDDIHRREGGSWARVGETLGALRYPVD